MRALSISNPSGCGPIYYKEGMNQTVSVEENVKGNVRFLKNDGKVEAALPIDWAVPAPTSDAITHLTLGCLPFYFIDKKQNAKVLIIGFGSGITAGVVSCLPEVYSLRIAELEPAVYEASRLFNSSNLDPFQFSGQEKGKLCALTVDGRCDLRIHRSLYDVIISQPSEPWVSGASDLFTREFWQLARRRLTKGGVICQWVQLYSIDRNSLQTILATFLQSFKDAYLLHPTGAGEVLLIGRNSIQWRKPIL